MGAPFTAPTSYGIFASSSSAASSVSPPQRARIVPRAESVLHRSMGPHSRLANDPLGNLAEIAILRKADAGAEPDGWERGSVVDLSGRRDETGVGVGFGRSVHATHKGVPSVHDGISGSPLLPASTEPIRE